MTTQVKKIRHGSLATGSNGIAISTNIGVPAQTRSLAATSAGFADNGYADNSFATAVAPLPAAGSGEAPLGFLIDMDGVIYRSYDIIAGAADFVHRLREENIPFLFLTNNSASAPRDYVIKLQKMGIEVEEHHFYTCAMATIDFLKSQKPRGTAYVIGESGLTSELHQAGYGITEHSPDYVIVGEGRVLNFEMAEKAMQAVLKGAHLIATNLDVSCPTATGTRPGAGAVVALLEAGTGQKAYSVGKPSPFMMRAARKKLGLRTAATVMVGDTMETDIRGGFELGFHTILVLTGSTKREMLKAYPYQPTRIVDSIADIDPDELAAELSLLHESESIDGVIAE